MSYHHSTILPLGALGWPMAEMSSYGMTDSDAIIPNKALCGNTATMQGALKDQGYYKGPIDSNIGSGTQAAIKAFSLANGLGSKVWPDPAFCAKLREKQNIALNAEYEKRNPPPPPEVGPGGGGDIIPAPPPGGQPAQPGGQQVSPAAPPPPPDNTMLYVAGGAGVLLLAAGVYFATR